MITGVAILDNKTKELWQLPKPARHHHVIWIYNKVTGVNFPNDQTQGFVCDDGTFLDREEGLAYAQKVGQLSERELDLPDLYSEDLW